MFKLRTLCGLLPGEGAEMKGQETEVGRRKSVNGKEEVNLASVIF